MPGERVQLGVRATVVFDREDHSPRVLRGAGETVGLRSLEDEIIDWDKEDAYNIPIDLIDEINIVSTYSLHVALYALQNPTPENIRRALYRIGTSGDCEEYVDHETLLPLPVDEPPGWNDWVPESVLSPADDRDDE